MYKLETIKISDEKWAALRYHRKSGKAWYIQGGKWVEIIDKEELSLADYVIDFMPMIQNWVAVRMDTISGRSWTVNKGCWEEVLTKETETDSTP